MVCVSPTYRALFGVSNFFEDRGSIIFVWFEREWAGQVPVVGGEEEFGAEGWLLLSQGSLGAIQDRSSNQTLLDFINDGAATLGVDHFDVANPYQAHYCFVRAENGQNRWLTPVGSQHTYQVDLNDPYDCLAWHPAAELRNAAVGTWTWVLLGPNLRPVFPDWSAGYKWPSSAGIPPSHLMQQPYIYEITSCPKVADPNPANWTWFEVSSGGATPQPSYLTLMKLEPGGSKLGTQLHPGGVAPSAKRQERAWLARKHRTFYVGQTLIARVQK